MSITTEIKNEFIIIVNFIENKENDYNERLKCALKALKRYSSLPNFEKNNCKFEFYRINRQLGSLYFETNNQYE